MEEKKQLRLFTWKHGILMGVAAAGGIGLNAYRTYKTEAHLENHGVNTRLASSPP
jgi:hypothetical protein